MSDINLIKETEAVRAEGGSPKTRVERYLEQKPQSEKHFNYATEQIKGKENSLKITIKPKDKNIESEESIVYNATLYAMTGTAHDEYARITLSQMANAAKWRGTEEIALTLNAFSGALLEMAPKDVTDGILCRRILTLDHQVNENLARAAGSDTQKGCNIYTNNAAKLSRVLNETIEARAKYLRKGEQKVTVQYQNVNVGEGGQAVVAGNVVRGGGVKKTDGKSEGVTHATT